MLAKTLVGSCQLPRPTPGDIAGVFNTRIHTHSPLWHVGGFFHADNLGLTESLIKH